MNIYYKRALERKDELLKDRHHIHQNAELGFDLPNTTAYVKKQLLAAGISPVDCGKSGITATIGSGSPVILLRADMDALPMVENTGLEFSSTTSACHSCGHDTHTSMLLMAARLLKEEEQNLKGTVKLMFQPAEELLQGAKDMIENGILENPTVDGAIGLHIHTGEEESRRGAVFFPRGHALYSGDAFRVKIKGEQAHGSTPEKGVDAIIIACHIAIALQNVLSRETPSSESNVLLVGRIQGGDSVNTEAGSAEMEVSIRATNPNSRDFLIKRLNEISKGIALTYRGSVEVIHEYGSPAMINDENLSDFAMDSLKDLVEDEDRFFIPLSSGTEDFAFVCEKVPSLMIYLGGGSIDEGYTAGLHNSAMVLDEDVLPLGAAIYAHLATEYLIKHSK